MSSPRLSRLILMLATHTSLSLLASPECVAIPCGWRHIIPQPIECFCPCDRYPHAPQRTKCLMCGHGHRPRDNARRRSY